MSARLLIIEDDPPSVELMTYLLESFGHTTLSARNGADGLEMAIRHRPDLIICDLHLPKMDGFQVVERLRADGSLREIPIVAVTALAMVGDRNRILAAGFDGYITKPIAPETFVADLSAFLPERPASPHGEDPDRR